MGLAIRHWVFVKGDHTNFEIEPSFGIEASALYPDVKYTTVKNTLTRSFENLESKDSRLCSCLLCKLVIACLL
ncbi:hypothetical protein AAZV13_06G028000 [Glycine max]